MKVLVVSDIHGSGYYAEKILEIEKRENTDKIIVLGDLYYHGPRNEFNTSATFICEYSIVNSFLGP